MSEESINIAEAKKHFSEILGQVAYGKKRILITKRDYNPKKGTFSMLDTARK